MKIKCSYCGAFFDDTNAKCPNCGAPNEGVVRTTKTQPLTIEELKKWYADRGLPPYETTRFFIGENYKKPRAFGIYKDEKTGNFVVYKNKDNGQRAVRYEGTDEAYAVNELFMRLKQEIIEQKKRNGHTQSSGGSGNNSHKRSNGPSKGYSRNSSSYSPRKEGLISRIFGKLGCGCGGCLLSIIAFFLFLVIGGIVITIIDSPETGYYYIEDEYRYFSDWTDGIDDNGWIIYDSETKKWSGVYDRKDGPKEYQKNKTAKKYFLSVDWNEKYECTDFLKSDEYLEISGNTMVNSGYYSYDDNYYYHIGTDKDYGWYIYDGESTTNDGWTWTSSSEVPEDLMHYYRSEDFFYTPTWDNETQITDFEDTPAYQEATKSSSSDDDDSWYNDDSDSSYDWGSSDSWDSGSSDWDSDW